MDLNLLAFVQHGAAVRFTHPNAITGSGSLAADGDNDGPVPRLDVALEVEDLLLV